MPMKRCVVRVDPQGKAMVVDILDTSGVSVTAYESSEFAAARLTLPMTITGQTDFCLPSPGPYDVSCKVGGTEVANSGAAKRVQAGDTPVRVVPDWERELAGADSAASGPVVGRLKLADNTTFYGVPFTVADGLAWSSWPVDTLSSSLTPGNVRYSVPVLWQDPVTVTEIVLIGDSPAHDADFTPIDSEVHVAFVSIDENWQPIGAPLWQDVIAVPSTISSGDELSWPGLSLAVPAGRYMWAIEIDYANPDTALQGVFLQSQSTSGLGTGICVADGGSMAVGLSVPHVYGTFVTAPTPTAAIPGVPSNDGTGVPAGKPANFVFCHWDPA